MPVGGAGTARGGVLAVGGSPEGAGAASDGPLLPFLAPLDDFGWLVGLLVSGGLYAALTLWGRRAAPAGD
ncbi:hypothetical protein ACFY9F_12405 [Streptomyces sp. NPDC012421]|uniref:hypothetical protein n=1 Tax=Streptomyces sp. NPDC012421 TaxID=3364832 RepID=UPI0036E7F0E2